MLSKFWWALLLRGIVSVALALLLWLRPGVGLATLMLLLGAYMLVDGIVAVFTAIGGRSDNPDWGWMLAGGVLGALVGLLTLRAPAATALVIVLYVAVWAMMVGVTQIVTAIRVRNEIDNEWMLILGGVLAVLLGLFILWSPGAGVLSMLWTIATFVFLFGLLLIFAALRLRGFAGKMKNVAEKVTGKV
jgi:uncharacterized membrane protein HdeD (DUF308 family)